MNQDEKSAILVVDDDPSVLESTSRLLSAFGYLVFSYGNATDALMKLQENNVRVVPVSYTHLTLPTNREV